MPKCPKCGTELEELPGVCQDDPDHSTPCECDDRLKCTDCNKIYYVSCVAHYWGDDELVNPNETWH